MIMDNPAQTTELNNAIIKFREMRVLCIGDLILDTYNSGTVTRISPESPIPVFVSGPETHCPGGAANVASNIAALGGHCTLCGQIGVDSPGTILSKVLECWPAVRSSLWRSRRRTSHKIRYVAQSQHMLRVDSEDAQPLEQNEEDEVFALAIAGLETADALVISDYAKGTITDSLAVNLIRAARARKIPVIVDPKARDLSRYAGANLITPNLKEAVEAAGHPMFDDATVAAGGAALIERAGLDALLITRSAEGMTLIERNSAPVHIRNTARDLFDVVGAGDTVVATLALGLAAGLSCAQAARLANIAAGIVVGKSGTATVSPEELRDHLALETEAPRRRGPPGLLSADEAVVYAANRRAEGKRVGFTNGVFDIVHPGHISLLEFSRASCDSLIVGVNSDASVRFLDKGADRPINGELDRASVVGAFGMVDAVVIFEDETPLNLIRALRPDVLIKGGDYTIDKVVGSKIVLAQGGTVLLADLVPGKSSTNIINRTRNRG